jgi:hypothetical protein
MAHGYLRDWDEGWGRSDERERSERDWRSRDDDRNWNRDRGDSFMLGNERSSRYDSRWTGQGGSDWERAPRNFRSHQDDHYLSWRDRQMDSLDRDYADYCREREQQFHRDFDDWRQQRTGNHQPLRTGMTQTGQSKDPSGELELTNEATDNEESQADAMAAATMGTNSGRRGR